MDIKDPKNRITHFEDGTISFDGSPDQLIALIVEEQLEKVNKERLERLHREGYFQG